MKIAQCMTRDVTIAEPDHTLAQAARMMAECDAGVLPVRQDDRLIGVITDRDIAIRGVGEGRGPETKVAEVMTREVLYCYEDETAEDVLRNMGDLQVRRLPVLNRDKRLVGIVSLSDLAANGETAQAGAALGDIARPGGIHSQTLH